MLASSYRYICLSYIALGRHILHCAPPPPHAFIFVRAIAKKGVMSTRIDDKCARVLSLNNGREHQRATARRRR